MFNRSYIQKHKGHPHYISDSKVSELMERSDLSEEDQKTTELFKHLSDPTKFRICKILYEVEELSVKDIALIVSISDSAASHALAALRSVGIVISSRCGKLVCYSLNKEIISEELLIFFINSQQ